METRQVSLFLKLFALFLFVLFVEYLLCGTFFRFLRHTASVRVDWGCGLVSPLLCYWIFRKPIRGALNEKVPFLIVAGFFVVFSFLLGCFFRFSIQLANGLLDYSDPETRVVLITGKKMSPFGGSVREGMNPEAHLFYFQDWDNRDESCELLVPSYVYYFADIGSPLALAYRQGFLHLAWVQSFQMLQPSNH